MKSIFIRIINGLLILLSFGACNQLSVVQVKNNTKLKGYPVFYYLPYTSISVDVEITKEHYHPGLYSDYSRHLLGVKPLYTKDSVVYKITDIKLKTRSESDTSQLYAIYGKKMPKGLIMTPDNRLVCINCNESKPNFEKNYKIKEFEKPEIAEKEFPFHAMKRHLENVVDTDYKYIKHDSVVKKVPVYNHHLQEKNDDKKAFEASSFIIKLRKRRFRMMTGMDKVLPPGESAEILIQNLNEMEQKYLDLFAGKLDCTKETYHYMIRPNQESIKQVLFYFSPQKGIVSNQKNAVPFELIIKSKDLTTKMDSLLQHQKLKSKGLAYRVPEEAVVSVKLGSEILLSEMMEIAQFGIITRIPDQYLKKQTEIHFCPKTSKIIMIKR